MAPQPLLPSISASRFPREGRACERQWAHPRKGHGDKPPHGGFRRQAAGGCQGMDAEAGALVGCDIVANVPRYRGAGQKVPVDCEQVLFRSGDVLVVMQGRRHSVMVPVRRVRDQSVGVEHRF